MKSSVGGGATMVQVCGRRWEEVEEAQGRVQGGQAANRTAWPWQVIFW